MQRYYSRLLGGVLALALGGADMAQAGTIYEWSMRSPIANITSVSSVAPWIAAGDVATLTVRYESGFAKDQDYGGGALYKNHITYFGLQLERGGSVTYSGSVSGDFGQISVVDNATGHDSISFRLRDAYPGTSPGDPLYTANYPSGTRSGTAVVPAVGPAIDTGDPLKGLLSFKNFDMLFFTDASVLNSDALPTGLSASDFIAVAGNTPWSGRWDLSADGVQNGYSFGPGSVPATGGYDIRFTASELPGGGAGVPLPATLLLLVPGLCWLRRVATGVSATS